MILRWEHTRPIFLWGGLFGYSPAVLQFAFTLHPPHYFSMRGWCQWKWWRISESNRWPPACKAGALASWANPPFLPHHTPLIIPGPTFYLYHFRKYWSLGPQHSSSVGICFSLSGPTNWLFWGFFFRKVRTHKHDYSLMGSVFLVQWSFSISFKWLCITSSSPTLHLTPTHCRRGPLLYFGC